MSGRDANIIPAGGLGGVNLTMQVIDRGGDVRSQIETMIPRISAGVARARALERV